LTKERIAKALGIPYETAEERQARDHEIESRLRALEVLAGVRAAASDPPAEDGSPDEANTRGRICGGVGDRGGAALAAAHVDLLPVHLPVQVGGALCDRVDVRVGK
jgi:hypothetical protein